MHSPGIATCFPLSRLAVGVATHDILSLDLSQSTFLAPLLLDAVVAPASSVGGWYVSAIPMGTLCSFTLVANV